MGNRWGPMVLWVLAKIEKFDKKTPEALRRNASGDFFDSSLSFSTKQPCSLCLLSHRMQDLLDILFLQIKWQQFLFAVPHIVRHTGQSNQKFREILLPAEILSRSI